MEADVLTICPSAWVTAYNKQIVGLGGGPAAGGAAGSSKSMKGDQRGVTVRTARVAKTGGGVLRHILSSIYPDQRLNETIVRFAEMYEAGQIPMSKSKADLKGQTSVHKTVDGEKIELMFHFKWIRDKLANLPQADVLQLLEEVIQGSSSWKEICAVGQNLCRSFCVLQLPEGGNVHDAKHSIHDFLPLMCRRLKKGLR